MTEQWRGRFLEDFEVGDVFRSRLGRTISEADNTWFALLTMNTNQMHFNRQYAQGTEFGDLLVVSTFTLAVVLGLSVADTSERCGRKPWLGRDQVARAGLRGGHAVGRVVEVLGVRESCARGRAAQDREDPHARCESASRRW